MQGKLAIVLLMAAVATTIALPSSKRANPEDRYSFAEGNYTHEEAALPCTMFRDVLVALETFEEQKFVAELMWWDRLPNSAYWTSGKWNANTSSFVWGNGVQFSSEDVFLWGPGEPSLRTDDTCVAIALTEHNRVEMYTLPSNIKMGALCEASD